MPHALLAYLVATCAYAGFQWTIRVVAYPQLAQVPAAPFPRYLDAYQRRVTYLVGPLFAALVLTTGWLAVTATVHIAARALAVALLGVLLATTGFFAVPVHSRLSRGWDVGAHRRLLRVDSVRVLVASASAVLAVVVAVSP